MSATTTLTTRLLLGCGLALAAAVASAQPVYRAQAPVLVQVQHAPPHYRPAPPPPRHEGHPRARRGQVWVSGQWHWQGPRRGYVWQSGYWAKAPRHGHGQWRR